jgi:hypothetical protein
MKLIKTAIAFSVLALSLNAFAQVTVLDQLGEQHFDQHDGKKTVEHVSAKPMTVEDFAKMGVTVKPFTQEAGANLSSHASIFGVSYGDEQDKSAALKGVAAAVRYEQARHAAQDKFFAQFKDMNLASDQAALSAQLHDAANKADPHQKFGLVSWMGDAVNFLQTHRQQMRAAYYLYEANELYNGKTHPILISDQSARHVFQVVDAQALTDDDSKTIPANVLQQLRKWGEQDFKQILEYAVDGVKKSGSQADAKDAQMSPRGFPG